MTTLSKHPSHPQQRVPVASKPSAASASEGMNQSQTKARRYMADGVDLWAAVAFAPDSEASLWTRVQCARLIAEVAGAIPHTVPEAPEPQGDGRDQATS